MKYDSKAKFVGVTGKVHKSTAEAKASFKLYPHGWVPHEQKFPQKFVDGPKARSTKQCRTSYTKQPDSTRSSKPTR